MTLLNLIYEKFVTTSWMGDQLVTRIQPAYDNTEKMQRISVTLVGF